MSETGLHRVVKRTGRIGRLASMILVAAVLASCRGRPATAQDCVEILDQIVQIELEERGFRDPVLLDRRRQEMRERLASEIKECRGKRLKAGALACVQQATSVEKISHACLR